MHSNQMDTLVTCPSCGLREADGEHQDLWGSLWVTRTLTSLTHRWSAPRLEGVAWLRRPLQCFSGGTTCSMDIRVTLIIRETRSRPSRSNDIVGMMSTTKSFGPYDLSRTGLRQVQSLLSSRRTMTTSSDAGLVREIGARTRLMQRSISKQPLQWYSVRPLAQEGRSTRPPSAGGSRKPRRRSSAYARARASRL